jgi:hypothetical protein
MLLFAPVANATLIEVETDGDEFGPGGPCALREAVEAARTNDAFGGCPAGGATDTVKLIGDDQIDGGAGRDQLNYNTACCGVTGIFINLGAGFADASNGDHDTFSGIEDVQGSEGDDEIRSSSGGDNLLIGGGGVDDLRAGDGVDVIDAKDGEADEKIDCGPGSDAKEKAKYDRGLDPKPKSC